MGAMHGNGGAAGVAGAGATGPAADRRGRPLRDLRVSVTDRCNFRCVYCMPKEAFGKDHRFLPKSELLGFEEIVRVVEAGAALGVTKVRLTGGEPLLRGELERLVAMVRAVPGITDLSMTTNASLMTPARARTLRDAGLRRINVSLDAIDDPTFEAVNDVGVPVARVLEGIEAATAAGFDSVKVNMVVKKGLNEHSVLPMARHFHGSGVILRFIEFMDVGNANAWDLANVTTSAEIAATIDAELPIAPAEPNYRGEVARRWTYRDGGGEIGIISSVSDPFCGDCSRARLSATGSVYTCLFATSGHDLRPALREPGGDVGAELRRIWGRRADRYSEVRTHASPMTFRPKVEMSFIGG